MLFRSMASTLRPRAAMQLRQFDYPVNDYYLAASNGQSPPKPQKKGSYLAIFRHEDVVWRMPLAEQEFQLLHRLFSGQSIGQALEMAQREANEEALAANLSDWFSRWMRNGFFAA